MVVKMKCDMRKGSRFKSRRFTFAYKRGICRHVEVIVVVDGIDLVSHEYETNLVFVSFRYKKRTFFLGLHHILIINIFPMI